MDAFSDITIALWFKVEGGANGPRGTHNRGLRRTIKNCRGEPAPTLISKPDTAARFLITNELVGSRRVGRSTEYISIN